MSREHQDALRVERENEGLKVGPAPLTRTDPRLVLTHDWD